MAKENDAEKILDSIRKAPRVQNADLFLFQEVANGNSGPSVAERIAGRLGYSATFEPAAPGVYDQGLALVSRYAITDIEIKRLKTCNLRFRGRSRFAVSATVETPWGGLRVWNAHLDTRINAAERLEQLQPVIDDAARHTGPRLIGGDFNTNDLYWLGNALPLPGGPSHGGAIRSAMDRHRFETFSETLNTFPSFRRHLDWIFVRDASLLAARVEPAQFSDHNALWVQVGL
jgi:endonuclease/exonuclease/phosphatase family metal-dependent hydrolase